MAAAVLLAVAILAQQTSVPPPERPLPPGAEAMFTPPQPSPDLVALRAAISAGPVDPEWSPATEAELVRAYRRVTGSSADLDVSCTRSLCEVLGVSRSGLTGEQINTLIKAVQAPAVTEVMNPMKLANVVQSFSWDGGEMENGSASVVFVAYWRRAD